MNFRFRYKLLRIEAQNEKHLNVLQAIRELWENTEPAPSALVNFWSEPALNFPTDLMVAGHGLEKVEGILKENELPYSILMEDVEVYVFIAWNDLVIGVSIIIFIIISV